MTLRERIEYFVTAAQSQEDDTPVDDVIDRMTPAELLEKISDALEHAGVVFNTDW